MPTLDLPGRLLFLSIDPGLVEVQLAGADFFLAQAGPLRDDVSTDEITPVRVLIHHDERLGQYPYVGVETGGRRPIGTDAVRAGRFSVTVAGKRYGKGSSREHSPVAEYEAGIRLVIAESFERIYRQNADNIGLFTSTDLGLADRIAAGEAIEIEELLQGRDALAAAILRCGGLLRYGQRYMGVQTMTGGNAESDVRQPMTLAEKILARRAVRVPGAETDPAPGTGSFVRADWRFIHEYFTGMCAHMLHRTVGQLEVLFEPERIVAFGDHLSYAHRSPAHQAPNLVEGVRAMRAAHCGFAARYGLRDHGHLPEGEGSEGIAHAVMAEQYVLPGQLVVGTDSHTPHSGALGCLAFGVGTTDMANSMITGAVRVTVPRTLRIEFSGALPPGVTAKDLILTVLADPRVRRGEGVGRVFEFAGPAIRAMATDDRATLTNMTAELGGFSGIVEPDEETVRFLKERRGVDVQIEPWMCSDPGSAYADVYRFDCAAISPMVAAPGDPGNGTPLNGLAVRERVDIAYGGSCTAGKREDFDAYHEVLSWAVRNGWRVAPHVTLFLQFGTLAVREYCVERGYLPVFNQVGAELLQPSCGACANCGPGVSTRAGQITVSAVNRNFPGRSGPGRVWLASPATVAASAIAGSLASFAELREMILDAHLDTGLLRPGL